LIGFNILTTKKHIDKPCWYNFYALKHSGNIIVDDKTYTLFNKYIMQKVLKQNNSGAERLIDNNSQAKTTKGKNFSLAIDNIPYVLNVVPFSFNGENRYYVKINEGDERVFLWDKEMEQFRTVDDSNEALSATLEQEISNQLLSLKK